MDSNIKFRPLLLCSMQLKPAETSLVSTAKTGNRNQNFFWTKSCPLPANSESICTYLFIKRVNAQLILKSGPAGSPVCMLQLH